MKKAQITKVNGNIFKSVVRGVVQEELVKSEKRLMEKIDDKFDDNYTSYRDDVLTKMDKAIAEMKKNNEEIAVHAGQHTEINDRLENLENIHPNGKHI